MYRLNVKKAIAAGVKTFSDDGKHPSGYANEEAIMLVAEHYSRKEKRRVSEPPESEFELVRCPNSDYPMTVHRVPKGLVVQEISLEYTRPVSKYPSVALA